MTRRRFARRRAIVIACVSALDALGSASRAAVPVVVANESGFEGLEEATVIYFPGSNTFQTDPGNFPNHVDKGGGLFRDTLRNYYPTLGWWDGDRAITNTDRQRTEAKGIVGLGHQGVDQTFEYSFDFRTNPGFAGTSHFCDFFQLKATDGNDGPPLVAGALYKSGSTTYMRFDSDGDGRTGTVGTFSFTAGQWYHVDVRITTCQSTESIGQVTASVDGSSFVGFTNSPIYLTGSTDYRPKFGFYRGIGTDYGVPAGDSWFEHRAVTGYIGSRNVLTWKGGSNANAWDTGATQNFLNEATPSAFTAADIVNFNDSTNNTTVNLTGAVAPEYVRVTSNQNYIFTGTGSLTSGTLRKDGIGTLTLATMNSYAGLTDVRGGTLYVTGSIGNNSLVSLTGGTLRAGSNAALGTNSTIGTTINGGALDINGFNLSTEPISVQGNGIGGSGAIVNTGAAQTSALTKVTLTGDTTLGGSGRWDIRGSGALLSTGGGSFNLSKIGPNQISLVGATVDPALGNITINQGVLAFQTSTSSMGDPTKSLFVGSGAVVGFYNTTSVMNKVATLSGGTAWAESGTGSQNTFAGPINLTGTGGTFDAGSGLTGGAPDATAVLNVTGSVGGAGTLTKSGPGTLALAGTSPNTYTGTTTVNAGVLVAAKPGALGSGALNVPAGGTVKFVAGLPIATRVSAITPTSGGGTIDLADNDLVIGPATPQAGVESLIHNARHAGAWDQPGLTSSAATGNPATGLGAMSGADYSSANGSSLFSGVSYAPDDTLVKYTWYGDTDFNGRVNFDDYVRTDNGFNNQLSGWLNGDFDYSGAVNFDDYVLIDLAFNTQSGTLRRAISFLDGSDRDPARMNEPALREVQQHFEQFGQSYAHHFVAAVPEPGIAWVVLIPLTAPRRRRARAS